MNAVKDISITITRDGPYVVKGDVVVADQHIEINAAGESIEWREGAHHAHEGAFKLCRCGSSSTRPFCDGTHRKVAFDGTETASRAMFDDGVTFLPGPTLSLKDNESLCAFARFCDPAGQVWELVKATDEEGPRIQFLHEAGHCPAGRLVAVDNESDSDMEPQLPVSIGLVEDTRAKVSGPIWVRGGIPVIGADGHRYEVRNRVALCRCGRSANKPYCNGAHAAGT